ncbi:MAG: hypothetical protein J0L93_11445 [Deltaproteobacteria bacterium]|nr:hypothetical protein [Deltaproteobacteria bacterium]
MSDLFKKFTIFLAAAVVSFTIHLANAFASTSFRPFCVSITRIIAEKVETKRQQFTNTDIAEIKLFENKDTNALVAEVLRAPVTDQRPLTIDEQKLQLALLGKLSSEKDISLDSWKNIITRLFKKTEYDGIETLEVQKEAAHQLAIVIEKSNLSKDHFEFLEREISGHLNLVFETHPLVSSALVTLFADFVSREGVEPKILDNYRAKLIEYRVTTLLQNLELAKNRKWNSGQDLENYEYQARQFEVALAMLDRFVADEAAPWISAAEFKLTEDSQPTHFYYNWYDGAWSNSAKLLPPIKEMPSEASIDKMTEDLQMFIAESQAIYERYNIEQDVPNAWAKMLLLEKRREIGEAWAGDLARLIREGLQGDSKRLSRLKTLSNQIENALSEIFKESLLYPHGLSMSDFEKRFDVIFNAKAAGFHINELTTERVRWVESGGEHRVASFEERLKGVTPSFAAEKQKAEPVLNERFSYGITQAFASILDPVRDGAEREKSSKNLINHLTLLKRSLELAEQELQNAKLSEGERFGLYRRQARLYSLIDTIQLRSLRAQNLFLEKAEQDNTHWIEQLKMIDRAVGKTKAELKPIYRFMFYSGVHSLDAIKERYEQMETLSKREGIDLEKLNREEIEHIGQSRDPKEFMSKLELAVGIFKTKPIASADSSSSAK